MDQALVRAEAAMREAFSAVIGRDGDAMVSVISKLGDREANAALNLARLVSREVVVDVSDGQPTDDQFRTVAGQIADSESWADLDADGVETYLKELYRGQQPTTGTAELVGMAYVVGGFLLAAYAGSDREWWAYLDEILDRIVPA